MYRLIYFLPYITPAVAAAAVFRVFFSSRPSAPVNSLMALFGLDPLRDDFTQECNNCTACIAVCPTDALSFTISIKDQAFQGPGHLGHQYRKTEADNA